MNEARRVELVHGLATGTLGAEEEQELAAAMADDRAVRVDVARQVFLHRVMLEIPRAPRAADRLMAALPGAERSAPLLRAIGQVDRRAATARRGRVATFGLLLAAAGVALGLGLGRRWPRPAPAPIAAPAAAPQDPRAPEPLPTAGAPAGPGLAVEQTRGRVHLFHEQRRLDALAGHRIAPGAWVATDVGGGAARLRLGAEAVLELGPDTVVAVLPGAGAPAAFLSRGRADLRVAGGRARVQTPHAEVSAAAARATIVLTTTGTRVQVSEGEVQVSSLRGGRPVEVQSGRFALVGEGSDAVSTRGWGEVVLVTGLQERPKGLAADVLNPADQKVKTRLEELGFRVRVEVNPTGSTPDLEGALMVLVSSSVNGKTFDWDLRRARIPVLSWEPAAFPLLGMVERKTRDEGSVVGVDRIVIKDSTHPLAAGFQGVVQVSASLHDMTWGTPNLWAAWVAASPTDPTRMVLFAYDRGASMPGGVAPARRVGFFLHDQLATTLTAEGWALFDAAVRWCAEGN